MAESTTEERTEQATDKRMKEVREKGKLQRSQDLSAWVVIGAVAVMLPSTIEAGRTAAETQARTAMRAALHPTTHDALAALGNGLGSVLTTVGALLAAAVVAAAGSAIMQGGVHVKKFTPKVDQFNPVTGLGRLFGPQAWWNGLKALVKTLVVAVVLWVVIQQSLPALENAGMAPVSHLLDQAAGAIAALLSVAVAAGLVVAFADVFVVQRRNRKHTRMTKKELRDENKSTEGDPLIRSQRRSRQLSMSRNRMIAAIGDSDVVLVNPTEYAVALRYEPGKSAPRISAMGKGHVAARIREEAQKTGVPMVKDIPLTRALHSACKLGQEIPVDFYNAVAVVLTFVAALKRRGSAAGVHEIRGGAPMPAASGRTTR